MISKNNLKDNIQSNIDNLIKDDTNIKNKVIKSDSDIKSNKFILKKKATDKVNKKSFPVYLQAEKLKELDRICKMSGYSRNELVNLMLDYCIDNLEFQK